jgi:hypothetical protein
MSANNPKRTFASIGGVDFGWVMTFRCWRQRSMLHAGISFPLNDSSMEAGTRTNGYILLAVIVTIGAVWQAAGMTIARNPHADGRYLSSYGRASIRLRLSLPAASRAPPTPKRSPLLAQRHQFRC